jgi:uncharacterized protein YoxC
MNETQLYHKINALSDDLKKKVEDYVGDLEAEIQEVNEKGKNQRKLFGSGKHLIKYISEDFDEPLGEFKEYME